METTLKVVGMSCGGCVKSVTDVLQALAGVSRAEVSLDRGEAAVSFDETQLSRNALVQAVDDAGFEAS